MRHPEQQDDEVFVCNVQHREYDRLYWKTKRMGEVAYDQGGNRLNYAEFSPVFVKRWEFEERQRVPLINTV